MCGKRVAAVLLPLMLAACGLGTSEPIGGLGNATVTTTGAVSVSGNAIAVFQSGTFGNASLFQIVVTPSISETTPWEISVAAPVPRLAVGTYPFTTPGSPSPIALEATFGTRNGTTGTTYLATSGELVITSSSPLVVRGTIHFTASTTPGSSTAPAVTVESDFTATCLLAGECQ